MTKAYPTQPRLSNRLSDLAERAGAEARSYKRASLEAHAAYLRAGAILAEARAEARRGEWGAILARAGISERVAQNMMALARAGFTAESLHHAGGVAAATASLRDPKPPEAEKTEFNSAFSPPPRPSPPGGNRDSAPVPTLYQRRREAGLCTQCGAAADGAARCPECARRYGERQRERRALARIGESLAPRLAEAAAGGKPVRLSAAEAAELAGMIGRKDAP